MPVTFTIRPLAATDFAAWKPLWDGYNAFYERVGPTALPDAVTESTWHRLFDASEPMSAFVAEATGGTTEAQMGAKTSNDNGALLGLVHCLFHRSTTSIANNCYLQDLFTTPEARGQGVGKALIEAVYALGKSHGVQKVYWHTRNTNLTAMRLYDHVGTKSPAVMYYKLDM